MIVGLVASIGRPTLARAVASLSDCDKVIVVEDTQRRGQAWTRNELLRAMPPKCVARFCDDDDIAMSSHMMEKLLWDSCKDVLAGSFISGTTPVEVPADPLEAAIDSVGPWSWAAHSDVLRNLPWEDWSFGSGTQYWLKMMKANARFGFAPQLWVYYWQPAADGITAQGKGRKEFFLKLKKELQDSQRLDLLNKLKRRVRRSGLSWMEL